MILTQEFYVVYPPGSKCHEANAWMIVNQYLLAIVIDSLVKNPSYLPGWEILQIVHASLQRLMAIPISNQGYTVFILPGSI